MASKKTLIATLAELGLDPLEDRAIVVKFAPKNLSARIAEFFNAEFYVLQLCKQKIVLIPFSKLTLTLKKEVTLEISYDDIQSVSIDEDGFNDVITINTTTDTLRLTAQQKELMGFRSSAYLSCDGLKLFYGTDDYWHGRNLEATLKDLQVLGR